MPAATAHTELSLSYAVRLHVVLRFFGQLCFVLAALTLVPLGVAALCGDGGFAVRCAIVVAALAGTGSGCARLRAARRIQTNEAFVIVALIFLTAPLVMAYPMRAPGMSLMDRLFETVSAVTTTGLTTTRSVEDKSAAFLFTRAWMQWYGGLGFVVLSLALMVRPGLVARQLRGPTGEEEDLVGNTKVHARLALMVYCALTVAGVALLTTTGAGVFAALLHTLSAVSTGGFSSRNQGLAGHGGWGAQALVIVICFSGALPLAIYHRAIRRGWRDAAGDPQLRGLLTAGLLATLLLAGALRYIDRFDWGETMRQAPLLAFSAQTTAGFSPLDIAPLGAAAKLILIVSMLVGGSVGSTAGGVKVFRLLIVLEVFRRLIRQAGLPRHAVAAPRLAGRRLEDTDIQDAFLTIVLFFAVIVLSWLAFLAAGITPLDALFEVVSATSTVGLSAGVTHAHLSAPLKGVLCADMLLGRLEIVALLVMVYPRTWFGRRVEGE